MASIKPWQVLLALVAAAILSVWALQAQAAVKKICNQLSNVCWFEDSAGHVVMPKSRKVNRARHRRHKKRRRKPEVRGYSRREDANDGISCKDVLTVIGDARPSEEMARDDAEKTFMRAARFRFGESWMSVENARDYAIRCSRASIAEVVGQVMHRCELMAKPCRPPFQSK